MAPLLVKQLLEQLAEQVKEPLDSRGFGVISDYINKKTGKDEITKRYLNDIYNRAVRAINTGIEDIGVYSSMMDKIVPALGYRDFIEFEKSFTKPLDPLLDNYLGNWWSIVRANAGEHILKAPIRIYKNKVDNEIAIEMKGGIRLFTGRVQLRSGNLFCELDSTQEKILYIIMKVGNNKYARLLQGTFAGISSAGDPIAGRELFLKEEKLDFEEMVWERLPIDNSNLDQRVNKYLGKYEGNCLKVGNVSVFDLSDLELNYQ